MVRVLVTRPQPAAAKTAAKLHALGHQPLLLPLARAVHHSSAALDALAQNPRAIAVTSTEAVRVLASLRDALDPYRYTPLYAVGSATAESARALGFDTVLAGPGTGQELAKTMLEQTDGSLLYLAGTPRTPAFEETMALAGRPITVCNCYRMIDIDHPRETLETHFIQTPPQVVLLYSPESARRFFDLDFFEQFPGCLEEVCFLCISDSVARIVPARFGTAVSVSRKPDEASLLALL